MTKKSVNKSAMADWKSVYDGKEPLETFLERNRPSQIDTEAEWIYVENEQHRLELENEDKEEKKRRDSTMSAMETEWEGLERECMYRRSKKFTAETLKNLAVKYKFTSGKWMIFASREQIDDLWFTVAKAVVANKLGHVADVSTTKTPETDHVICTFTKDFTDENDVQRVKKGLRDVGIQVALKYKPDVYTELGIYSRNTLCIPVVIYYSQAVQNGSNESIKKWR
ncbi:hypothetical protein QZH41_011970 [Actinostola sp. cb2023]|nr:hypothetical protein QZH41_011970 [Actinostola sp. cb2023]